MYKFPINQQTNVEFEVNEFANLLAEYDSIVVIIDSQVRQIHRSYILSKYLSNDKDVFEFSIDAKEENKSLSSACKLIKEIDELPITKNSCLVAIGGGVIGDIAGFIASILLRGINYVAVPTTFLAMIDSSFGGKNGLNGANGKNRIGTVYQPKQILIDLKFVKSLDDQVFLSSLSEVIKAAMLHSPNLLDYLSENSEVIKNKDSQALRNLVSKAIQIKHHFVKDDVNDSGKRQLLNLGHSFAHAIELLSGYKISHGEAVAFGMLMACKYSVEKKYCPEDVYKNLKNCLELYISTATLQSK
ncbi:MAG: 3-dehydroquinate synthase family protein, partial [Rickettsiales bacterium]